MITTLCEQCFPDCSDVENLSHVPLNPCDECGKLDDRRNGGTRCHMFRNDPRATNADKDKSRDKLARPDCFDFGMEFLGDPEEAEIRAYVERLESELNATRWIDIKEHQPKDGQVVLVAIRTDYSNAPTRFDTAIACYKWGEFGDLRYPTHWMPLPEPPTA